MAKPALIVSPILKMKGFTLIELLIVITIIMLLAGGSLATFINYRDRRVVLNDANTIVDELKKAQRQALAGEKPTECSGFLLQGYDISLSADTISLSARCEAGSPPSTDTTLSSSTIVSAPDPISFAVLNGGATPATIQLCGNNQLYQIEVDSAGSISQPQEVGTCP